MGSARPNEKESRDFQLNSEAANGARCFLDSFEEEMNNNKNNNNSISEACTTTKLKRGDWNRRPGRGGKKAISGFPTVGC